MVVDGQHRLAAATLRGDIAHLPCVITSLMPTLGDEAAAFVALNQNRKPLQPLDHVQGRTGRRRR
jgi:ParB-like chromosome segregation protein Spo0J